MALASVARSACQVRNLARSAPITCVATFLCHSRTGPGLSGLSVPPSENAGHLDRRFGGQKWSISHLRKRWAKPSWLESCTQNHMSRPPHSVFMRSALLGADLARRNTPQRRARRLASVGTIWVSPSNHAKFDRVK
eukprot:scaffold18385_cov42-Phaeocystis_antarctica.AAC.7